MAGKIRLDKYLGEIGIGTRTQIREMAKMGRIEVNHVVVRSSNEKIDPSDEVMVDKKPVLYLEKEYIMLNKPKDVISATYDGKHKTVINLVKDGAARKDLFPVGRLDIDTEGLLILTNDGDLSHRLLAPKKHVPKTYYLETDAVIPDTAIELFEKGFHVDEELDALPSKLEILTPTSANLTIHEGKFHQVKRMMHAVGCEVVYLKRISMGGLKLDESLEPGMYRRLTDEELLLLQNTEN